MLKHNVMLRKPIDEKEKNREGIKKAKVKA